MNVREILENQESTNLSPWASLSSSSIRDTSEEKSDMRTEFQRDRDRIIHSNSFKRLKRKTQVFIAPPGDHYMTRLTHTLEVTQIARTIGRALRLNEDLIEAIGLGHDLGHTPFGHIGEQVLNEVHIKGFRHNYHSVRIVEKLEKDGEGLNLTKEVRQGILAHSKPREGLFKASKGLDKLTIEAQVVRLSDAIAYLSHDIRDSIRANLLSENKLPAKAIEAMGNKHSSRVNSMVQDVIEATNLTAISNQRPRVTMTPKMAEAMDLLRDFMFENIYLPAGSGPEGHKARAIVNLLYSHFVDHPEQIPNSIPDESESSIHQIALDFIAGMTDNFAVETAEAIQPGISENVFEGRI